MKKLVATLILSAAVILAPMAAGASRIRRDGPNPFPCWPRACSIR
jgi:hypothetical protein